MNDKDRDLIMQILQTAGHTGQQGFAYLVHYKLVDGITDVIGGLIFLALSVFLIKRAATAKADDDDEIRFACFMAGCVMFFISVWATLAGATTAFAPEGAAVNAALKSVSK